MSRFARMLGTLLGAGVPLINALNVARRSIGNQILVDAVSNSIERVKEGKALGPSLGDCRTLFSGSVLEMIAVAEESGKLDQELVRIANVTEGDLDRQLKTAVAMAEPLMLFSSPVSLEPYSSEWFCRFSRCNNTSNEPLILTNMNTKTKTPGLLRAGRPAQTGFYAG